MGRKGFSVAVVAVVCQDVCGPLPPLLIFWPEPDMFQTAVLSAEGRKAGKASVIGERGGEWVRQEGHSYRALHNKQTNKQL